MTYNLLEDVRVLELGNGISAAYCGKLLAGMGAQVAKIETPRNRGRLPELRPLHR